MQQVLFGCLQELDARVKELTRHSMQVILARLTKIGVPGFFCCTSACEGRNT